MGLVILLKTPSIIGAIVKSKDQRIKDKSGLRIRSNK